MAVKSDYWVGRLGGKVLVVFDRSLQPKDPKWVFLYFVHGNALKTQVAAKVRKHAATVKDPHATEFAISHYEKWKQASQEELERRRSLKDYDEESPPLPRKECQSCSGQGSWHWTVGTFSEGGHSDGQNFHDICSDCHGEGYVYILS